MAIILGKWTEDELNRIIRKASGLKDAGSRIVFISEKFLDTGYSELTLSGDKDTEEVFVINLAGVDCFTFIDYIEAMRLSESFSLFRGNLIRVRYRGGQVSFENRNHFFTDWIESNSGFIDDVTGQIGGQKVRRVTKILNQKGNGTYFVKGIQPARRAFAYIPSDAINQEVLNRLQTGDYAGIYSDLPGLDVSHVGIIIKEAGCISLRHASKQAGKVIDQDFTSYISDRPGLVVLRPGQSE